MPIHDWTRVKAGIFHDFHHGWISQLSRALNRGLLAGRQYKRDGRAASPGARWTGRPHAGAAAVTTVDAAGRRRTGAAWRWRRGRGRPRPASTPAWRKIGIRPAKGPRPPAVRHASEHNTGGDGSSSSLRATRRAESALSSFVRKAQEAMEAGIHLLIVDLFPPGRPGDPGGIHRVIWEDRTRGSRAAPGDAPRTCVPYVGSPYTPEASWSPWPSATRSPRCPCSWSRISTSPCRSKRPIRPPGRPCPSTGGTSSRAAHPPEPLSATQAKKRPTATEKPGRRSGSGQGFPGEVTVVPSARKTCACRRSSLSSTTAETPASRYSATLASTLAQRSLGETTSTTSSGTTGR